MLATGKNSAQAGRHFFAAILALWLGCGCVGTRAEIVVTDDAGNRVVLPRPATRIVSLAPHITELLYATGAGEKVVATVTYADFPAAAKALPRIGSNAALDLERIVALRPDLAIVWGSGNPPGQVEQLRRLKFPVFVNEPKRLEDIPASLRNFALLAGVAAEPAARAFEHRLASLRDRHARDVPVSVFYEIWHQPLMTVGGNHIISAALAVCAGRNVFAALPQPAANIGIEAVLRADPDVIVASGMDEARPEWLDHWQRWPLLKAVMKGNLFFVPPDLLQRHTPRLLDGVEQLCAALDSARQRDDQPGR
jgi:iron complex transport system substrate-binding protein